MKLNTKLFFFLIPILIGCNRNLKKNKLTTKQIFSLEYCFSSSFAFNKDTVCIVEGAKCEYPYTQGHLFIKSLTQKDTLIKYEDLNAKKYFDIDSTKKRMKAKPLFIKDIFQTNEFKYEVISNRFLGVLYYKDTIKYGKELLESLNNEVFYKNRFGIKENILALKTNKNYCAYLTEENNIKDSLCINILNLKKHLQNKIYVYNYLRKIEFSFFDIIDDTKPELLIFVTDVFSFRGTGTLKVFKILDS